MLPGLPARSGIRRLSETVQDYSKALLRTGLARFGLELWPLPSIGASAAGGDSMRGELPPIFEDPFEALHCSRGGIRAAFQCPIAQMGFLNGLSFGKNGWNPFSATAVEMQRME